MGPCNTAAPELTRQDPLLPGSRLSPNSLFNHGWLINQTIPQTQGNPQVRPQSTTKPKKKPVQSARAGQHQSLNRGSTGKSEATGTRGEAIPAEPSCSAASRRPTEGTISSRKQAITRTPIRHSPPASPNYYQGYYNNWGSAAQACPPGRA